MFLHFLFCLFLSCGLFFVFLNQLNTSPAPSHPTVPSGTLEGKEAFAAKSDPLPLPPGGGRWGSLALSSPGACVCSAEGAGARRCPSPAPCPVPLPPALAARRSSPVPPGARLRCK